MKRKRSILDGSTDPAAPSWEKASAQELIQGINSIDGHVGGGQGYGNSAEMMRRLALSQERSSRALFWLTVALVVLTIVLVVLTLVMVLD